MIRNFFLYLTLCFSILMPYQAQARVDILPHIVIIDGRERSGEVFVLNLSEELRDFNLSVINYKQDEKGVYKILDGPLSPLFDPKDVLRMSPKSFQLAGLGRQKVRLSIRKPSDLPDGEYRFHVMAMSPDDRRAKNTNKNASVAMAINLGIAIPVIVRYGDVSATGKIKDLELVSASKTESHKPELKFMAEREGNSSTIGRIDVAWAPDGKTYEDIGFIANFNLFTEINKRYGSIPLQKMPRGGTVRVLYTDEITKEVYDEVVFEL